MPIKTISLAPLAPVLRGEGLGVRGFALSITIAIACTLMLGCCGCESSKPASEDYTPHAAVTLGQNSIDSATPTPSPKPSDGKCKNCKGVGKVGDGRTMLTCDVCKGTGKDTKQDIDLGQLFEAAKEGKLLDRPLPQVCDGDQCFPEGKAVSIEDDPEANVIPSIPFVEPSRRIPEIEPETKPEPEPDPDPEPVKQTAKPTIRMHTSDSCGPCKLWIAQEKGKWESMGWTVLLIKETETSVGWPWFDITDGDGLRFSVYGPLTTEKFFAAKKMNFRK
jgi:hypothetical protein